MKTQQQLMQQLAETQQAMQQQSYNFKPKLLHLEPRTINSFLVINRPSTFHHRTLLTAAMDEVIKDAICMEVLATEVVATTTACAKP
jgi:hypothetical protein